jgi:PGF-pre-PGF domain-containing protein
MFYGATVFNQNLGNWNVSKVTNMQDMFRYKSLSTENYDSLLQGWSSRFEQNNTLFHGGNSKYSNCFGTGNYSRNFLIDTYNWSITDGGWDSTYVCVDTVYPTFSNYWDNNASLNDFGIGLFNVTLLNTNGTVLLEINGANITASNVSGNSDVFNVSYNISSGGGVYSYKWHSWGNGTSHNYNVSETRSYTVNVTGDFVYPHVTLTSPVNATTKNVTLISFNFTATDDFNLTNATLYFCNTLSCNFAPNLTLDITGITNTTNITVNLADNQTYLWNVKVCDSSNKCNWSNTNYTLIVNSSYVYIINYPKWCGFHAIHTEYSDGDMTPEQSISTLKQYYDCAGTNDHDAYLNQTEWTDWINWSDEHNVDNNFTFFFGTEWSQDRHHIYYITLNPSSTQQDALDTNFNTVVELTAWLQQNQGVAQHNHPARLQGSSTDFSNPLEYNETLIPLVEMVNSLWFHWNYYWNCSENSGCDTYVNPKDPSSGNASGTGWIKYALDRGMHLGFSCGGDDHGIPAVPRCYTGLANSTTPYNREGIYNELRVRHTFVGENKTLMEVTSNNGSNDFIMGDIFNYSSNSPNITISYVLNASAGLNIKNISLFYNGIIVNHTQITPASGVIGNFTQSLRANQEDYIFIETTQSNGQRAWSSPMWITYNPLDDSSYPIFSSYWDNNGSLLDSGIARFNVTLLNTNGTVILTLNGTNYTSSNNSGDSARFNVSVSLLNAGVYNYTWKSYGNGTDNNYNVSETRSYTVNASDSTFPQIVIITPLNNTNSTNINLDVNYTVSDNIAISSCWYSNDTYSINLSLGSNCVNLTNITWSQGSHNVTVYANDTSNNINSSRISFTVDSIPPYFNTLANQSLNTAQSLSYDIDATDAVMGLGVFAINWTSTFSINSSTGLLVNASALTAGNYYINVSINDTLGNLNSTILFVNVTNVPDTTAPYFTTIPSNLSINYTQSIGVDFNATDGIAFGTYAVNDSKFAINSSGWLRNDTALGVGIYFINISINDTSNNLNSTIYLINLSKATITLGLSATTPITYPTATDFAGTGCSSELTCSLNLSNGIFGVGTILANYSTIGNANYSASSTIYSVIINQNTSSAVYTYLNNSRGNITIYNNTAIYLNATLFNVSGIINLYNNGTRINVGSSSVSNLTSFNETGIYNITGLYEENTNYSGNYETWWVNVIPALDITYPSFSTYWDNNASLTNSGIGLFNVTLANTNGTIFLEINGANVTASNNSGNVNVFNATYNFSSGGIYSYKWHSWGNGTSHNYNVSETRSYTINDTLAPIVTLTSPSNNSTQTSSSTVDFVFNVIDASSIANCSLILNGVIYSTDISITRTVSQTISPSLSNAAYNWSINCTDTSNNSGNSSTRFVTVSYTATSSSGSSSSSSSSSSSGGGETNVTQPVNLTVENFTTTRNVSLILPNNLTLVNNIDASFGVKEFYIEVNNEVQDVQLVITRFSQKPDLISEPENNNVYKYLEMHSDSLTGNIKNILVVFQIQKDWATVRGIEKEKIALFHFNDSSSKWDEIATRYIREENNYYFYEGDINSFSYFYIGESLIETREPLPPNVVITFIKTHLFWVIAGVLIVIFLFVFVKWIILIIKRKKHHREKGFTKKEIKTLNNLRKNEKKLIPLSSKVNKKENLIPPKSTEEVTPLRENLIKKKKSIETEKIKEEIVNLRKELERKKKR